jgi:AI-2 transport protein TqsA
MAGHDRGHAGHRGGTAGTVRRRDNSDRCRHDGGAGLCRADPGGGGRAVRLARRRCRAGRAGRLPGHRLRRLYQDHGGQAGNLLVAIVLVILYVGFLFAERPWFAAKISRLFPQPGRPENVDDILTSISRSIHHYLLVKTAVSAVTGILVYLLLLLLGMDFAETLALLSFILNFIPNIGSIVATILPALVALVHYDGWAMVLVVLVSVGGVQFLIGNIVDPMLMGRALHLSSFAIILSLTFWGAVWGIIGMFLAVPIMVMVMIVCSHVPALRPIAILLSRDGNLPKEAGQRDAKGKAGKE